MITALPTRKLTILLLGVLFYINTASAGIETIPAGSFIINMGVVPQTYSNGIKPYGMIWTLIRYCRTPVKWVINQNKIKDGADFNYNGVDYKGGTFIILKKFRSAKVDSIITSWQAQGVVGVTTISDFAVDVTYTIKYNPLWTFDAQNGKIAQAYLTAAGIPIDGYPIKDPDGLNACDDLFIMPHADPTWGTHSSLLFWNKNNRGWLWYGCHAGSVIESTINPIDSNMQMNFLTTKGLVNFADHNDPTAPFSYRYPADPEMQFMGSIDLAVNNGSEQVYLPLKGGGWRASTHVAVYDPTDPDVPALSDGEAAIIAYGRAFGDSSLGKVMFQAGHNFDKGNAAAVSAIRAFFNFSYLSVLDKIVTPIINGPINLTGNGGSNYSFTATLPQGYNPSNYSFHWSASLGGTFSNEYGPSTQFIPAGVGSISTTIIMVTITDGCGREYYQTLDFTVQPTLPVALDRTTAMFVNSPGSGAKGIGNITPLAGTDVDGYVVNYIIKSLPTSGVLFYDNDNNPATPDVAITSIPAGGLSLTAGKMKSLKYDAADSFGGSASFQYTVQDNANLYSSNTAVYTIPVNPPPITQNFVCAPVTSNAGLTKVCPLVATDNVAVINYTILSLPLSSKCLVYLYNVLVTEGQVLTPDQATLLTFKPVGNYLGYAEITYTATDNDGASDETASTITLQMVNQAPVPQDISANVINNPVGAIQISIAALNATDVDGTVASYMVTNIPASTQGILYYNNNGTYKPVTDNQVLTLSQSFSLKFDPVDTYSGVAKFKYVATDNGALTSSITATYSIPVKAITPVATTILNTSIYSGAGLSTIKPLAGHDNDTTDIIKAYIIKNLPTASMGALYYNNGSNYVSCTSGAELTTSQGTTLKFNPTAGFTGNAVFTYTVKDDEGLLDPTPATFTIPVTNSAPSASDVKSSSLFDTSGTVIIKPLKATDADGSVAKYIITSLPNPSTGILKLNNQPVNLGQELSIYESTVMQFSPVLHNDRDAIFTFTAVDDLGTADATEANYTIPITMINFRRAPHADNKTTTQIDHKAFRNLLPVSGSDSDGVVSNFMITGINSNDGTLYLQGTPVIQNQVISVTAADQFTYTADETFKGTTTFSYVAIDNDGMTSPEATFNIPVENIPPVANDFTAGQVKTHTTTGIQGLQAKDEDGTIKTYKILTVPSSGKIQYDSSGTWRNLYESKVLKASEAASLRITSGNTAGMVSFTFYAKDNNGDTSNIATYQIPVGNVAGNQNPYPADITTSPIAMNAGQTLINPLSAIDPDGTILAYVIQSIPPSYEGTILYDSSGYWLVLRGVLTINPLQATTLKFLPSGTYSGNVTFTYKAIDATNQYSTEEATYTIPIINTIAAANVTNPSIANNGPANLSSLTGTGKIAKYYIITLPPAADGKLMLDGSYVTVNQEISLLNAGRLEFEPAIDFKGNTSFKYNAADNLGNYGNTTATFTIPVTDQAPVAYNRASQVITNYLGTPAQTIPALTAIDFDGSISNFYIKTLPTNGKLYKNGTLISTIPVGGVSISNAQASQLSFDPDDNFGGTVSFTYTAKDNSNNLSSPATYFINVNTPPVTNNLSSMAMFAGQPRTGITALNGSDDGSVSYYSLATLPSTAEGTIFLNNVPVTSLSQVDSITPAQVSQLSFQPTPGFDGVIFTYTAIDNTGLIDVTPAVYDIPYNNMGTLNPLPLELLSFSGYKSSTDNILYWSMSQEINSDHYEVERSINGMNYTKIGTLTAAGNSSSKTNYTFNDKNVTSGNFYYRVKLVDGDGSYKYSKTIAIKRNTEAIAGLKILSNPFRDKLVIELMVINEGKTTFTLYDLKGNTVKKIVMSTPKGMNHIEIESLSNISSAIYMLNISNNDGNSNTQLYKAN